MFKINRKVEYALLALKHIKMNSNGNLTSAKEICAEHKIPFDPTARSLQIMAQEGILKAEQGAKGGYRTDSRFKKVSLKDLSEMLIGPIHVANCLSKKSSFCERSKWCSIIKPMNKINLKLNELFESIKVSDLLDKEAENK